MPEAPKIPDPRHAYANAIAGLPQFKSGTASLGKMAFIGILMALLLIPMSMIQDLIRERERNGRSAASEGGLAVLSTRKRALTLGAMLAGLYAYLFTLLQMEDFALLAGALGLFAILAGVMYLTRRLNPPVPAVAAEAV